MFTYFHIVHLHQFHVHIQDLLYFVQSKCLTLLFKLGGSFYFDRVDTPVFPSVCKWWLSRGASGQKRCSSVLERKGGPSLWHQQRDDLPALQEHLPPRPQFQGNNSLLCQVCCAHQSFISLLITSYYLLEVLLQCAATEPSHRGDTV